MSTATVLNKVTIGTVVLQDVVSRAAKGSTNQDIIPLSCLMKIEIKDNKLFATTTDNVNYLTATTPIPVNQPDFSCVVKSKLFSSLISKITTDTISLSIEGDNLVVKGNGTYKIKIETDSDGSEVSMTVPEFEATGTSYHITPTDISDILQLGLVCKADNKEFPAIYNYYADNEKVLTTDNFKGCKLPIPMFDKPTLLPPKIVSLIPYIQMVDSKDASSLDGVDILSNDTSVVFESANGRLYGPKCTQDEANSYPADGLVEVITIPNVPNIPLIRTQLLQAVDRMSLLSSPHSSNKLKFTWDSSKVTIVNKENSMEDMEYPSAVSEITEPVVVSLDSVALLKMLGLAPENLNLKVSEDGVFFDIGKYTGMTLGVVDGDEETTEE